MEYLTTGRLAKEAGVNIDTVRYYEKRGLIPKPARKDSGYRLFKEDAIRRIAFIKHAQEIGFSLREVEELLSLRVNSKTTCGDVQKKTEAKIVEVESKILNLQRIKRALEKMTDICRSNTRTNECPILDMLDADGRGLFRKKAETGTMITKQRTKDKPSSVECPACGAGSVSGRTLRHVHAKKAMRGASAGKGR